MRYPHKVTYVSVDIIKSAVVYRACFPEEHTFVVAHFIIRAYHGEFPECVCYTGIDTERGGKVVFIIALRCLGIAVVSAIGIF